MPAPIEFAKRRILQSWKEIAEHLGVTVRSVQRWERSNSGLPIHRQGRRVFAYPDELQRWVESGGLKKQDNEVKEPPARLHLKYYGVAAAILLLVGAASMLIWQTAIFPFSRVPDSWSVEGSLLKVFDADGRECWHRPLLNFDLEQWRSQRFILDKCLIDDIDGDGQKEVLINTLPYSYEEKGGSLLCLDHKGRLRWEYAYGHPMTFGTRKFDASYVGRLLKFVKIHGKPFLLTVANHHIWYPAHATILEPKTGRSVAEYWHPGWILHCVVVDINRDGTESAVFGAINNPGLGLGHAALAVVKIPFPRMSPRDSTSPDPYPPLTGGGEAAYILFATPDVCRITGSLPGIASLNVVENSRLLLEIGLPENGGSVYSLDFNLNVLEHHLSDNFPSLHDRFYMQHLLDHALTPGEIASLGQVARFPAAPDGNNPALEQFWKFNKR